MPATVDKTGAGQKRLSKDMVTKNARGYDVASIKQAASGRWPSLLADAGFSPDILDGKGHTCPWCGGTDRFSFQYPDTGGVFCRSCFDKNNGDGIAAIKRMRNLTFPQTLEWIAKRLSIEPASADHQSNGQANGTHDPETYASPEVAIATWESILGQERTRAWAYHDADGNAIAAAIRFDIDGKGKEFRPVSISSERWILKAPSKPRPLYRLPDLKDAKRVYIVEGEKCADAFRSIGLTATTAFGGSKGVNFADWSPIAGCEWIASRDQDQPGVKWLKDLTLIGANLDPPATVKELQLPFADPKQGDDGADWIDMHDAVEPEQLREMVEELADKASVVKAVDVDPRNKPSDQETARAAAPVTMRTVEPGTILKAADRDNFGTVIEDRGETVVVHFVSPGGDTADVELKKTQLRLQDGTPLVRSMPQSQPISIARLIQDNPTLHEPVVDGLLRRGETMNIIAAPKAGKSWLVYSLALSVATGRPWLDTFPCNIGGVLMIDNELHDPTLAKRIPRVADALGITLNQYQSQLDVWSLRGELVDLEMLGERLNDIEPGTYSLIIIDAFYRILPENVDENSNAQITPAYSPETFG